MAYNKDFYKAYQDYLKEKPVRDAHGFIFNSFHSEHGNYEDVLDLGCGQSNEFHQYYKPLNYLGIDENAITTLENNRHLIHGNYRDRELLKSVITKQTAFVSLFSSEVHAPYKENYHLYNWIFKTFPNIQAGLVSGLYHSNRRNRNPMIANGNKIYQTLENIEDCHRVGYTEKRIIMEVPSKLFGKFEVEVWKIFQRI